MVFQNDIQTSLESLFLLANPKIPFSLAMHHRGDDQRGSNHKYVCHSTRYNKSTDTESWSEEKEELLSSEMQPHPSDNSGEIGMYLRKKQKTQRILSQSCVKYKHKTLFHYHKAGRSHPSLSTIYIVSFFSLPV